MTHYYNFNICNLKKNGNIWTLYRKQMLDIIIPTPSSDASLYCDISFDQSSEYELLLDIGGFDPNDMNMMRLLIGEDMYMINDCSTHHIFVAKSNQMRICLDLSNLITPTQLIIKKLSIFKTFPKKMDAVLLHMGNHNMWNTMHNYLIALDSRCYDLWISLVALDTDPSEKIENIKKTILESYPSANILIVPNKGMDIGGFFYILQEIFNKKYNYRYILKLHTKTNNSWRDELCNGLLDHRQIVQIMSDRQIGMIGSKKWSVTQKTIDRPNRYHFMRLIDRFNLPKNIPYSFVGGTIFWIRYDLLYQIYGDHLDWIVDNLNDRTTYDSNWMHLFNESVYGNRLWDGVADSAAKSDGMIEHALERFLGYSMYCSGRILYRI